METQRAIELVSELCDRGYKVEKGKKPEGRQKRDEIGEDFGQ